MNATLSAISGPAHWRAPKIERLGGTVVDRVLGRGGAQVLIVGRSPGSKVDAALVTGARLLGEGGLNAILADVEVGQ